MNAHVRTLLLSEAVDNLTPWLSHTTGRATFAVVLGADVPPPPVAVLVPTTDADPVRGTIDASRLRPVDPSAVRAGMGRLTPDTLRQMDRALRTYFDLL